MLAFVFGSLLALVPLLIAAMSILVTFLLILGLAELTEVSVLVRYLVALIGLDVAIDYCLLLVTLTLLPVLLATAGRRIDWPQRRKPAHASGGWLAWARGVVRARWLAALTVLVPLGIAAFGLVLGTPRADALPTSGPARTGLVALEDAGLPTGILTPLEVLVPAGADLAQVADRLVGVQGVRAALAPDKPACVAAAPPWWASNRSPRRRCCICHDRARVGRLPA